MKIWGIFLMTFGVLIAIFSSKIVSPGLDAIPGIKNIVRNADVVFLDGYPYVFKNPDAMAKWIVGVAVVGLVIFGIGVRMFFKGMRRK